MPEQKPILALDGDQIIFDYCSGFIGFCIGQGYQLNLNSGFDTFNMTKWFNQMLQHEHNSLIAQYNRTEHPKPFHGVASTLQKLAQEYELCVVSSYSDDEWAKRQRQNYLMTMGITNIYLLSQGECKVETLKEIGADLFVDDNPTQLKVAVEHGINTYAVNYPYNQGVDGVKYINTLEELL